jgi:tetratricopeptide (TPR) repeat protein
MQYVELNGEDGEFHLSFRNTLKIYSPEPGERLSGEEFTVSWEEIEDAAYYKVEPVVFYEPFGERGISTRIYAKDKNGEYKFTENQAVFNINMIRNNPYITVSDSDNGYLGAQAVLGIFIPGVEYPIVVNAYDENNNLITGSLPLRSYYEHIPSITAEGSLNEGENFIYRKNYPAAIEYYENILKENPDDIDALRYLTRIYGIGWKEGEQNFERAFTLGQRYTEISGNRELLTNTLGGMNISEIKENRENVYLTLKEAMKDPDFDNYYFLSRYYIAVENYEGAREALQMAENVTDNLIFLNMYFGDYKEAVESIKSERFYRSRLSSNKVKEALESLSESPPKGDELKVFNDFLLKLINSIPYNEGQNVYDETVKQISNNNIKTILDEIYLERNWDIEY